MITRKLNGDLQLVLQVDHDDLSGKLAERFGGGGLWDPVPREPVIRACAEHDDGWLDWEESPEIDPESGRAWNFRDLEILRHLAFYRAGIGRVTDRDPYAGMLVSKHGSGIYKRRYDLQPEMIVPGVTPEIGVAIDEFIAEQEAHQQRIADDFDADADEVWNAYKLLQAMDRLSLYFCMDRPEVAAGVGPIPFADGSDAELVVEPLSEWSVRLDPYPFREPGPQHFSLDRRVLPDRVWDSDEEFGEAFFAAPVEAVEIEVRG
ncbi:MAG: DUF3891 family protein [Solirubrobacterales bacterium]